MLGCSFNQWSLVLEDLSPGLDGVDVFTHVLARSDILLEMENETLELLDSTDDVELLKVVESGVQVSPERSGTCVTGLELGEVVLTNHTVHEASGEFGKSIQIHCKVVLGL